jgi:hypothetical protein
MAIDIHISSALITALVAVYGAILSTIIGINQWLDKRPRIKVSIKPNMTFFHKGRNTFPDDDTFAIVTAVNISQRPTTITSAALLLPNKKGYLLCNDSVCNALQSVELTEGKHKDYYFNEANLKKEYHLSPDKYVAIVNDNAGRAYYSHNIIQRFMKLRRIK